MNDTHEVDTGPVTAFPIHTRLVDAASHGIEARRTIDPQRRALQPRDKLDVRVNVGKHTPRGVAGDRRRFPPAGTPRQRAQSPRRQRAGGGERGAAQKMSPRDGHCLSDVVNGNTHIARPSSDGEPSIEDREKDYKNGSQ